MEQLNSFEQKQRDEPSHQHVCSLFMKNYHQLEEHQLQNPSHAGKTPCKSNIFHEAP
jgi:hypothetical protein